MGAVSKASLQSLLPPQPSRMDILDGLGLGVLVLDTHWNITYANAAAGRVWSIAVDAVSGRNLFEVLPDLELTAARHCCESVQRSRRRARFEFRLAGVLDTSQVYEVHVDPLEDGVSLLAVEVTDRHRSALQIRKLHSDLDATLSALPDLLFEISREGVYLKVWASNPSLLARRETELIGRPVTEVMSPDAAAICMLAIGEALDNGHSFGRVINLELNGKPHWFELSLSRKENLEGREPTLLVLSRDITEGRNVYEAMRRNENLFRSLFNHSPIGIALADLEGRYTHVNHAMHQFLGYDDGELVGRNWRELTHPEDVFKNEALALQLLAGEISSFQVEKRYLRRDGRPVWTLMVVSALRGQHGRIAQTLGQMLDIDALKRNEADLLRSRQQLREFAAHQENMIDAERKHIAAEIHDHLGQQLTAMRAETGLLRMQHGAQPGVREFCQRMNEMVDETIATVRDLARMLHPVELEFGLGPAVLSLTEKFSRQYGIACEVQCPAGDFSPPRAVASVIYRVIQESLTNVARHARASRVNLAGRLTPEEISIEIADDGVGFDVETVLNGRSYGLFGMKERVNTIGGELTIVSSAAHGTRITITLPWRET